MPCKALWCLWCLAPMKLAACWSWSGPLWRNSFRTCLGLWCGLEGFSPFMAIGQLGWTLFFLIKRFRRDLSEELIGTPIRALGFLRKFVWFTAWQKALLGGFDSVVAHNDIMARADIWSKVHVVIKALTLWIWPLCHNLFGRNLGLMFLGFALWLTSKCPQVVDWCWFWRTSLSPLQKTMTSWCLSLVGWCGDLGRRFGNPGSESPNFCNLAVP